MVFQFIRRVIEYFLVVQIFSILANHDELFEKNDELLQKNDELLKKTVKIAKKKDILIYTEKK